MAKPKPAIAWQNRHGQELYSALSELTRETNSWTAIRTLALVEPLCELEAVHRELVDHSPRGWLDAIGRAVDAVLRQWKQPDRQPVALAHGRDMFKAGAILFRRPDLMAEIEDLPDIVSHARANASGQRFTSLERSQVEARYTAVGYFWLTERDEPFGHGLRNQMPQQIIEHLAEALNPRGSAAAAILPPSYSPPSVADFDRGFWWRSTTTKYIELVAAASALTLFAGGDGYSDVGLPQHQRLVAMFLEDWLNRTAEEEADTPSLLSEHDIEQIVASFSGDAPSLIGSMVRGLAIQEYPTETDVVEGRLRAIIDNQVNPGKHLPARRGFVAPEIARLANTAKDQGREVAIVSAHYDSDIESALGSTTSVDLYTMHATSLETHATLSEADLFLHRVPGITPPLTWADLMIRQLTDGAALFVGTDIRSPGLIAALAKTRRRGHVRFAILLPPGGRGWDAPTGLAHPPIGEASAYDKHDRELVRARTQQVLRIRALGARYLDLGVIPILADFPYQVPQILREIQLCLQLGNEQYRSYAERCEQWWIDYAAAMGQVHGSTVVTDRRGWTAGWRAAVAEGRKSLELLLQEQQSNAPKEQVAVEVWLRDPANRELFLWQSSDVTTLRDRPRPRVSLRMDDSTLQKAFREGARRGAHLQRLPWAYAVALPLRTSARAYGGVPIGVVRILSTAPNTALAHLSVHPELEATVKRMRNGFGDLFAEPPISEP